MVELFQLILGVLASLFKSRARLEAECMNSLSSRRGSESGEAPIEELIRVSHPRVGYACQVCVVGLPRSESRRSASSTLYPRTPATGGPSSSAGRSPPPSKLLMPGKLGPRTAGHGGLVYNTPSPGTRRQRATRHYRSTSAV